MAAFNCVRCGKENWLNPYGYGGVFKGKLTCKYCGAVHNAVMQHQDLSSLELAGFEFLQLPKEVPQEIKEDYHEAQRCSQVNAYKGVVTLCRRALQVAVEFQGAGKKGTLKEKIDNLKLKGLISSDLASLAHGIRFFGNYGAHPQEDELKQITKLEAETTFSLTGQLLRQLFKAPIEEARIVGRPTVEK